jgi:hypothetical protein
VATGMVGRSTSTIMTFRTSNNLMPSDERPPSPRPGFEADLVREIESLFTLLPSGVAQLRIGRIKGHPEWTEPDFEITPANPRAARFGGHAVATDLYLSIGGAEREFVGFASGGNIVRGAKWQQEFRWIWQSVLAGGFTQKHYMDSNGKIIGWATKFLVNGRQVVFRNGRRKERMFALEKVETVTYEPYR